MVLSHKLYGVGIEVDCQYLVVVGYSVQGIRVLCRIRAKVGYSYRLVRDIPQPGPTLLQALAAQVLPSHKFHRRNLP